MNYWMGVATLTGIYMIAILGVSILTGFTGLFSMGHAGFMAIGAYTSALITKTFHVPILVGVFCGMLTALVIGLIIGYPTLKLKGGLFCNRHPGNRGGDQADHREHAKSHRRRQGPDGRAQGGLPSRWCSVSWW